MYTYLYKYIYLKFQLNIYVYIQIYVYGKVKMLVTRLYLTLCDPMDSGLPGSSVHGILQARILE